MSKNKIASAWSGGNEPMNSEYGKMMMWFFLISDALTFSGFLTAYAFVRFRFETQWPVAEDVFTHFPGLKGDQPLLYVAFMTFVLIMSSVTMVLAVNAGHQLKRNVTAWWMVATIIGGGIFVSSQAWEWYHFIIGDKGAIELSSSEVMKVANRDGNVLSLSQVVKGMDKGHSANHELIFSDEEVFESIRANNNLFLQSPGKDHIPFTREATIKALDGAHVIQGANMYHNEYGKQQFANFFFFITGFHGFHVFSGVVLNVMVFYNVMLGTYDRRKTYGMVEKVGLYWHFVDLVWVFVFTFFYLV
jgi:cytochrome c oxidase subunit 3